jgi:hypothetical protein
LKPAETYIRICQLRFLTRIAHMDPPPAFPDR